MTEHTQLKPGVAAKTRAMIAAIDTMPMLLRYCLTPKEAAEVRSRVDALNHVLRRHCPDESASEGYEL